MTSAPASLRERSRVRRRRAIQRAALRLFAERGYDGTTLTDIAQAAEVAPRTISGYFPSKIDLALSESNEIAARLTAIFHADPDAHFLDVVGRWLTQEAELSDPELAAMTNAMFAVNPELRARGSAPITEAMQVGSAALYAEIGMARDDPMASVVAASIAAAIIEYQATIARHGSSPDLLATLLRYLRAIIKAASSGRPRQVSTRA